MQIGRPLGDFFQGHVNVCQKAAEIEPTTFRSRDNYSPHSEDKNFSAKCPSSS